MNTPIVPGDSNNDPQYNVVNITPDLAKKWLALNTHNRNLRETVANSYAADMRTGNWREDGQSIRFSAGEILLLDDPFITGNALLDGQHRLSAITIADVTVRMLVVSNLPEDTQETMDTGAKRTLADVLKLRGEANAVSLAAALMRIQLWKLGARKNIRGIGAARPTHRQLLALLEEHPEIRRSVEWADRAKRGARVSGGNASVCHWLFNQIDQSDCAYFFARLCDGAGLLPGDPVYALRRVLDNLSKTAGRPDDAFVTALMIKAWNLYRAGQEVQTLAYKAGGASPEAYPEPK